MRSTLRRALRPFVLAFVALCPLALPSAGRAISETASWSGPSIPWWNQIVDDGIALQVDIGPLAASRGGVLRARHEIAFRFRLYDVATGQPLVGLAPSAWVEPIPEGEPFDPERCGGQVRSVAGTSLAGLGERSRPGTYETVARLGRAGRYEVLFLVDAPRIVQCFQVDVRPARLAWLRR